MEYIIAKLTSSGVNLLQPIAVHGGVLIKLVLVSPPHLRAIGILGVVLQLSHVVPLLLAILLQYGGILMLNLIFDLKFS